MGLRFRKSFKVAPGVRLNLGKKSASVSIGGKGARFTASTSGRRTSTVGIPGTGLSYSSSSGGGAKKKRAEPRATYESGAEIPAAIADIEVKWPPETKPKYPHPAKTYKTSSIVCFVTAGVCLLPVMVGGWFFLLLTLFFGLAGRFNWRIYKELTAGGVEAVPEAPQKKKAPVWLLRTCGVIFWGVAVFFGIGCLAGFWPLLVIAIPCGLLGWYCMRKAKRLKEEKPEA